MGIFIRWGWLLGISLLAPISLPAGGAQFLIPQIRSRKSSDPFLTTRDTALRASPLKKAPVLRSVPSGTPFTILRHWQESDGQVWTYVHVLYEHNFNINSVRNGWLDIDA